MYKSPVELITKQMNTQIEDYVFKAIQEVVVNIDKEELIRALEYDRGQYDKGYRDGLNANKWISVEDKLPDNEDYVLCWYEYRIVGGTHDGEKTGMYGIGYYFKGWTVASEGRRNVIVRAWQKLPIPPRGKNYE